MNSVRLVR